MNFYKKKIQNLLTYQRLKKVSRKKNNFFREQKQRNFFIKEQTQNSNIY